MSGTTPPPDLADTRPSTRLVYTILGEEWLSYAEVSERTGLSLPSTSRACQRLDELDLVERRRNPDEPRAYQVRLGPDGVFVEFLEEATHAREER